MHPGYVIAIVLFKRIYFLVSLSTNKHRDMNQKPRLQTNTPGIYLKISSFDPGFVQGQHFIRVWCVIKKSMDVLKNMDV